MMYSFRPVPEDWAGAIITLVGLGHERRGHAGRSAGTRGYGIQASYVRLTITRIHLNHPMQIRLSFCTLSRGSVQTAERWGLLPLWTRCVNHKFRSCALGSTGQALLNTGVKNLLAVIRSINRPRHRPILYPHHAIISHEEVCPTTMMHS
jgi:hypothetical protein